MEQQFYRLELAFAPALTPRVQGRHSFAFSPVYGQTKFVYGRHGNSQEGTLVDDAVVHLHDAQRMHT